MAENFFHFSVFVFFNLISYVNIDLREILESGVNESLIDFLAVKSAMFFLCLFIQLDLKAWWILACSFLTLPFQYELNMIHEISPPPIYII